MNVGQTLFSQLMEYVPWKTFGRIVDRYQGDAGTRTLDCARLFRVMVFAQLTWRESLRDVEACLGANRHKLFHMGIGQAPARSTISDALNDRDWRIYHEVAIRLIGRARMLYANEPLDIAPELGLDTTVYALDATTIDLCLSLFDWARFRQNKGAIKLHTLLDLRGAIPAFIHISDGKMHEVGVLDQMAIESGAFYVMDRGYVDFSRLYRIHQAAAFFVTRAKSNMNFGRRYSSQVSPSVREVGVLCDQTIVLKGYQASKDFPTTLRRVKFKDPASSKTLVFITNNTTLPPQVIAALYKNRWQVETFFKWIKQHLRIKRFMGTSQNAVKSQIWCAISTYVLIAIIKKELVLPVSLYTLLQIYSVSAFEKTSISRALQGDEPLAITPIMSNQLNLF